MWGRIQSLLFTPEPQDFKEALAIRCKCDKDTIRDAIYNRRGARSLLEDNFSRELSSTVAFPEYKVINSKERYAGEVSTPRAEALYEEVMKTYCPKR